MLVGAFCSPPPVHIITIYIWLDKLEDLSISWCVLKNEEKTSAQLRKNKVQQVLVSLSAHRPAPVGAPSTDLLQPTCVCEEKFSRPALSSEAAGVDGSVNLCEKMLTGVTREMLYRTLRSTFDFKR